MGGSICPSPYSLAVYYQSEIEAALSDQSNVRLQDFLMGWDETNECKRQYMERKTSVEYWFCIECKRIYEVQVHGRWLRVFQWQKPTSVTLPQVDNDWKRIYVFPDTVTDAATEANIDISLADFLRQEIFENEYFVSPDEKLVVAQKMSTKAIEFCYQLEDVWIPE
jgi:hypothetical protein